MTQALDDEGGLGMLDLGAEVEVGAYVTIEPLLIPSASCLPLGDQDTVQRSKYGHHIERRHVLDVGIVFGKLPATQPPTDVSFWTSRSSTANPFEPL
jgi:hypothetical protein